jgi:hypothetical protein
MANSEIVIAKNALHEIAMQAYNLAMGLQNVAPPPANSGASIQYLKEISLKLEGISKKLDDLILTGQ